MFGGNTKFDNKLASVFEPQTEIIRKGKTSVRDFATLAAHINGRPIMKQATPGGEDLRRS